MAHDSEVQSSDEGGQPAKTRTWWHPLLARLLDHVLATAYAVLEEVPVGKMPLRVDILLLRRGQEQLSEASHRSLSVLLPLLNRFTLIEFKGPTDSLRSGDLAQLVGCCLLWHSQQAEEIRQSDISLVVLAPGATEAFRNDLRLLGCRASRHQRGVASITGLPFATWLVETDRMNPRDQPILSLVSRVFLKEHRRIIEELSNTGHGPLLHYVLQQVRQFRNLGEDFAMQHRDMQYLGQVEEELQTAFLATVPTQKVLERLRGLPPEEVLRRYTAEEVLRGLSEQELSRLRELLERRPTE